MAVSTDSDPTVLEILIPKQAFRDWIAGQTAVIEALQGYSNTQAMQRIEALLDRCWLRDDERADSSRRRAQSNTDRAQ